MNTPKENRQRILSQAPVINPVATIRSLRLTHPHKAIERAQERKKLSQWPQPLLLAAGDHPARLLTAWRGDPLALADRSWYLRTLIGFLASQAVDGVEATPDVMEELLFLDSVLVEAGEKSFLDEKILIGTMNRSGLSGTCFEMADEASAFTISSARNLGLDGVKWMWRLAVDDPLTLQSQRALVKGLTEAYEASFTVMLEVDWVEYRDGKWVSQLDQAGRMVELVGVASGWGPSSCNRYLELPANEHLSTALGATTLPVCVLPPEVREPGPDVFEDYQVAPGLPVAGQLLGRDIMLAEDPVGLGCKVADYWRREFSANPV